MLLVITVALATLATLNASSRPGQALRLVATVLGTLLAVAALTTVTAWHRRPAGRRRDLQAETA